MRFVRGLEGVLCPALVALVFAGYPTVLHAQTTSASVSGSVQDAQGGVLPGVTVTMTSRTQGNVADRRSPTPVAVSCSPSSVPTPIRSRPRCRASRRAERTNLVVNANDKLSTGSLTLEVGALTEEVTRVEPRHPAAVDRAANARSRSKARR